MTRVLVVATVGTDIHPFDRLVDWVDAWCDDNPGIDAVVQYGESRAPVHADAAAFLGPDEIGELLEAATTVVCHGGPSSIMDARSAGVRPLVVPRDPSRGEHVDDHQIRFTERLADEGLVELVSTRDDLHKWLDRAVEQPGLLRIPPDRYAPTATVERFGRLVDDLCRRPVRRVLGVRR